MPDLQNRDQHEAEFAYGISAVLNRQRRELAAMGLEAAAKRDSAARKQHEDELAAILFLLLLRPWEDSYGYLSGSLGLIEPRSVRADARDMWARDYSRQLSWDLDDTNQEVINRTYLKQLQGETLTAAQSALAVLSSLNRIETIAITETTRAASEGEEAAAGRIQIVRGMLLMPYWFTQRDERVCPVCGPLHDQPGTVWRHRFASGPPAHVRCRCWREWRMV
jgi:hypothetical protein